MSRGIQVNFRLFRLIQNPGLLHLEITAPKRPKSRAGCTYQKCSVTRSLAVLVGKRRIACNTYRLP